MHPVRKRRLFIIMAIAISVGVCLSFVLYSLRQNINLYVTPSELLSHQHSDQQTHRMVRLGGMVVKGSVHRLPVKNTVIFRLTDYHQSVTVRYCGILPALFREGQGIVAEGCLGPKDEFIASQVLAKHDANYHPPKVPTRNTNVT